MLTHSLGQLDARDLLQLANQSPLHLYIKRTLVHLRLHNLLMPRLPRLTLTLTRPQRQHDIGPHRRI